MFAKAVSKLIPALGKKSCGEGLGKQYERRGYLYSCIFCQGLLPLYIERKIYKRLYSNMLQNLGEELG